MVHKGGGGVRYPFWRQAAAKQQLRDTLENILVEAREWWQWGSGSYGGGYGGEEESDSESDR